MQVLRRLGQDYLQRRPDTRLYQMSAMRRAIGFTEHNMCVNLRSVVAERDVSQQRQHLDLFSNGNFFIFAAVNDKKPDCHVTERTYRSEPAGAQVMFSGELFQSTHHFVACFEDEREGL